MLNPDYKDMLRALSEANIDFLLVGAYAVAADGHPRATGDSISGFGRILKLHRGFTVFLLNSERHFMT